MRTESSQLQSLLQRFVTVNANPQSSPNFRTGGDEIHHVLGLLSNADVIGSSWRDF